MNSKLLLPNKYKIIGWCILIPATIFGIILMSTNYEAFPIHAKVFAIAGDDIYGQGLGGGTRYFTFIHTYLTTTIAGVLFIVGALMVGFSREKREDEFISNLRQSSLLWAVFVNYILLLLAFVFVYSSSFFTVMIYNMFTVLIIFIVRFNYVLFRNFKAATDEK